VLICGPLVVWSFFESRRASVSIAGTFVYVAIVFVVAAPWYAYTAVHAPEATGTFFWLHNFVRYLTPFDHEKPVWFYFVGLAVGMLPWSFLFVPLLWYLTRGSSPRPAGLGPFLIAFLWCLAFFSFSGCKRPGYILPALPPLAMMLGTCLTNALPSRFLSRPVFATGAGLLAVTLFVIGVTVLPTYHEKFALRTQVLKVRPMTHGRLVICYPKRWDSVSFYLMRQADCCTQSAELVERLLKGDALLLMKNDGFNDDLIRKLPSELEYTPIGQQVGNARVGLVERKAASVFAEK